MESRPLIPPTGWVVRVRNGLNSSFTLSTYAVCVSAS